MLSLSLTMHVTIKRMPNVFFNEMFTKPYARITVESSSITANDKVGSKMIPEST